MIEETNVENGEPEEVSISADEIGDLADVFDPEVDTGAKEPGLVERAKTALGLGGEEVVEDAPVAEAKTASTPDPAEDGPEPKPSYHQCAARNAAAKNKRKYG
jgi:hypothetical protein